MRKTIFTALVTLLVMLAVVSCDNIIGEKPEYTADGRQLVTLNVDTGVTASISRTLTDALARDEANYVEVIFLDGTDSEYFRAEGYLGSVIKIKVPVGDYGSSNTDGNDAIILIGRKSDKTLLATGTIDPADADVTTATKSIAFNVTSLTADISTKDGATSAFKIDESTGDVGGSGKAIEDGLFATKTYAGLFEGEPWFQVPENTDGIGATLTISGFAATGDNIIIAAKASTDPDSVTFSGINNKTVGITVAPTTVTPAVGDPITAAGEIGFKFDTTSEGFYIVTFKIPVVGFDATIDSVITWYIRGGTNEGQPDFEGHISNTLVDDPNYSGSPPIPQIPDPNFKGDPNEGVALAVSKTPKKLVNVGITTPSYP